VIVNFVSKHFVQYCFVFRSTWKSSPRLHSSNNRLTKDSNPEFQLVKIHYKTARNSEPYWDTKSYRDC